MLDPIIFPARNQGERPVLVEFEPIPEPMLLRVNPNEAYAVVSELVPVGNGQYEKRFLSASVVPTRVN